MTTFYKTWIGKESNITCETCVVEIGVPAFARREVDRDEVLAAASDVLDHTLLACTMCGRPMEDDHE